MKPRKMPPQRFCDDTTLLLIVEFAAMHVDAAEIYIKHLRSEDLVAFRQFADGRMITREEAKSIFCRRALQSLARFRYCEARAATVITRLHRKARR